MPFLQQSKQQIEEFLLKNNYKSFHFKQINEWIYKKNVSSFDEMSARFLSTLFLRVSTSFLPSFMKVADSTLPFFSSILPFPDVQPVAIWTPSTKQDNGGAGSVSIIAFVLKQSFPKVSLTNKPAFNPSIRKGPRWPWNLTASLTIFLGIKSYKLHLSSI